MANSKHENYRTAVKEFSKLISENSKKTETHYYRAVFKKIMKKLQTI